MTTLELPARIQFWTLIRRARSARRWTQDRLATEAGLHPMTVRKIEAGSAEIGARAVAALTAALALDQDEVTAVTGLSAWALLDAAPEPAPAPPLTVPLCPWPYLLRSQIHPGWLRPVPEEA